MGILANNEDPDEMLQSSSRERSGSVLDWRPRATGLSITGVTALCP